MLGCFKLPCRLASAAAEPLLNLMFSPGEPIDTHTCVAHKRSRTFWAGHSKHSEQAQVCVSVEQNFCVAIGPPSNVTFNPVAQQTS